MPAAARSPPATRVSPLCRPDRGGQERGVCLTVPMAVVPMAAGRTETPTPGCTLNFRSTGVCRTPPPTDPRGFGKQNLTLTCIQDPSGTECKAETYLFLSARTR